MKIRRSTHRTSEARRILRSTLLVTMLVSVPVTPVSGHLSGIGLDDGFPGLSARAEGILRQARRDIAETRIAAESDSYLTRVRTLLGPEGDPTVPPVPPIMALKHSPALAPPVARAVAGLAAAVGQAGVLVSLADPVPAALAPIARPVRIAVHEEAMFPMRSPGLAVELAEPEMASPKLRRTRDRNAGAGLMIAAALDRYLPALREADASPRAGTTAAGCDLVDLEGLCVGSDADNTYTENENLLIDLGGDDIYLNSAGGAASFSGTSGTIGASVNVDLRGDDRYESGGGGEGAWIIVAQGSAFGGVGVLVDEGGDDTYTVKVAPQSEQDGLGQGGSLQAGFAALFDDSGNDRYTVQASLEHSVAGGVSVIGQGIGSAGAGGLFDGGGDDEYLLDAGRQAKLTDDEDLSGVGVIGQGYSSLGGSGVLVDAGGTDSFTMRGAVGWEPRFIPADPHALGNYAARPIVQIHGQGASHLGRALLLEGDGPTTYRVEADVDGVALHFVNVQGYALGGLGALDDRSGDDAYRVSASSEYRRTVAVDDPCTTPKGTACSAASHVEDQRIATAGVVIGQGGGSGSSLFENVALLEDHAGSDEYAALKEYRLELELEDRLSAPTAPASLAVHSSNSQPELVVQGATAWTGNSFLVDHEGSDSYIARYLKDTTARATSLHAPGPPDVWAVNWYRIGVVAQGAVWGGEAVGVLMDLGGSNDRFKASAETPVRTIPPGGGVELRAAWPHFHAGGDFSVDADALFYAGGSDAVVVSSPSEVVCPSSVGARGFGAWHECYEGPEEAELEDAGSDRYGRGGGFTSTAGRSFALAITPDSPLVAQALARGTIPYAARLSDVDGAGVDSARLHFDLQFRDPDDYPGGNWESALGVDGVTDEAGVASVQLPLDFTDPFVAYYPDMQWRVMVTFDGAPGVAPQHDAQGIALTIE